MCIRDSKNTYGTGCFLLMNTGDTICRSQNGLISTIGISLKSMTNLIPEEKAQKALAEKN